MVRGLMADYFDQTPVASMDRYAALVEAALQELHFAFFFANFASQDAHEQPPFEGVLWVDTVQSAFKSL